MKTNSHNVGENPEKQSFKKSYLKRITEEKEAHLEIERCIQYDQEEQYETHRKEQELGPSGDIN